MNVLVAMDSFKGSLSTFRGGAAVEEGVKRVFPEANVRISPLADGGEGTVAAIIGARGGEMRRAKVCGPLGESVTASYGFLPDEGVAVIEMAEAAGLTLVPKEKRDPLCTTTYGVGELIRHAVENGARRFIIGIGGSATNDGGVGMLSALGYSFTDAQGEPIPRGAIGLSVLSRISDEGVLKELRECSFTVACDVTNPLCGELGCSAVYAPQKGASEQDVRRMDAWLAQYAALSAKTIPTADPEHPGSGAAGGLGFAFHAYLGARLESGVSIVLRETELEKHVQNADVVITGEGRLDGQSCMGKAPVGVAALAKKFGKTVIAFAGCVREDAPLCHGYGIDAFFPILRNPVSVEEAMDQENAYRNLADTAEEVFRLIKTCKQL